MQSYRKYLRKCLFIILICTFTVGYVNPAVEVSAAREITLRDGSTAPTTVYAGNTYNLKVTGTLIKYYSSDKEVATINVNSGKFTPIAPGTVKISAKNKYGKVVAAKTFKVLQRATAVKVEDSEISLSLSETFTLKAKKIPSTSTDVIRFYSSDRSVAVVGSINGKITPIEYGTTTIQVYSKATVATEKSSESNKVTTVTVHVCNKILEVTQTWKNQLTVKFADNITSNDIILINKKENTKVPIQSINISNNIAVITTENDLDLNTEYTVQSGMITYDFVTATIASISIEPLTVNWSTVSPVYVVLKDTNGVELDRYEYGSSIPDNITFNISVNRGVLFPDGIYLYFADSTATVSAVYYDKNDTQKADGIATGDVVITVEPSTVSIIHETTSNVESDPTGSSTPIAGPTDSPDNAESPDRE